jgi:hypothetical protein
MLQPFKKRCRRPPTEHPRVEAAIAKIIPVFHKGSEQSLSAGYIGSLRRNSSSGKCSMYSSSAGGICR